MISREDSVDEAPDAVPRVLSVRFAEHILEGEFHMLVDGLEFEGRI